MDLRTPWAWRPAKNMIDDQERSRWKDYWTTVQEIAKEAKEADEPSDSLHEQVDGSEWVIYTWRGLKVLEYSPNEGHLFDEMGLEGLEGSHGFSEVIMRMAFWAMLADCQEALADLERLEDLV